MIPATIQVKDGK